MSMPSAVTEFVKPRQAAHRNLRDLRGLRFGRLCVVSRSGSHVSKGGHKFPTWACNCDCGNSTQVIGQSLRTGITRSCGWLAQERRVRAGAPLTAMIGRYKRGARKLGVPFSLSREVFASLVASNCNYCGQLPSLRKSTPAAHKFFKANGVDRVYGPSGYVEGNVVACCPLCNQAKNDLSVGEFLSLVRRIHSHSVSGAAAQ